MLDAAQQCMLAQDVLCEEPFEAVQEDASTLYRHVLPIQLAATDVLQDLFCFNHLFPLEF